ncbi:NAD(P)H-dependent oxidoreductase [Caulobacter sp. 17J80-11]|uniref:NAD(P)H-dependent oxidoreductase n=1 Tax=Caulobacter sp. 17J80-11 TaxID=2763502 RepID=UPI0016536066|nr:NAD(P)H-dependent oxidoreductase [Caulobacter sp. 17J80-11]MBC6982551.1 NAD(P)H-dependent oxidoreductase [Caulobacter sp. 17J80-11]
MPGQDDTARTLLVLAHPALERARMNPALADAAQALPGVTLRDLYELYPDFTVDVRTEQKLLLEHDLIVLQFPLFWYSAPSLLKEWIDAVWLKGFAYGPRGVALRGKTLLCVISTSASAADFTPEGDYRFSLTEFLRPFEQTARYCGLKWAEPFVVFGEDAAGDDGLRRNAEAYRDRLSELAAQIARTLPTDG